jgi:ABC-type transporter Mla subunit MlaD
MSFGASLGTATAQVNVDISQAMRSLDTLQTRLSGMGNLGAGAFDNANKQLKSLGDRADEIQRKFGLAGKAMLGFGAIVGSALPSNRRWTSNIRWMRSKPRWAEWGAWRG